MGKFMRRGFFVVTEQKSRSWQCMLQRNCASIFAAFNISPFVVDPTVEGIVSWNMFLAHLTASSGTHCPWLLLPVPACWPVDRVECQQLTDSCSVLCSNGIVVLSILTLPSFLVISPSLPLKGYQCCWYGRTQGPYAPQGSRKLPKWSWCSKSVPQTLIRTSEIRYSQSIGEVNSNRVTSSLLQKWTRLPTHACEVGALTFEVTDNFGSNDLLPCGAYGPRWFLPCEGGTLATCFFPSGISACNDLGYSYLENFSLCACVLITGLSLWMAYLII